MSIFRCFVFFAMHRGIKKDHKKCKKGTHFLVFPEDITFSSKIKQYSLSFNVYHYIFLLYESLATCEMPSEDSSTPTQLTHSLTPLLVRRPR